MLRGIFQLILDIGNQNDFGKKHFFDASKGQKISKAIYGILNSPQKRMKKFDQTVLYLSSGVDSGGAGSVRAPPEFGGSEKGRSLISTYWSLAITASTSGIEKLSTALPQVEFFFVRFLGEMKTP